MAAPPRHQIFAVFDNGHREKIFGFDGFPGCWADKVGEWEVEDRLNGKFIAINSPTNSREFKLYCGLCMHYGCTKSGINKPSQRWFSAPDFASNQHDIFTHSSVHKNHHDSKCLCVGKGIPSISQGSNKHQTSLQMFTEYSINRNTHSLIGRFRVPDNDPNTDPQLQVKILDKLDDMLSKGYLDNISYSPNSSSFWIEFEVKKIPPTPKISFQPSRLSIPGNPIIHIWFTLTPSWNNLIFWRPHGLDLLKPIDIVYRQKGNPGRLILSRHRDTSVYIIDKNSNLSTITSPLVKRDLGKGNHPLGNYIFTMGEKELRSKLSTNSQSLNNINLELHRTDIIRTQILTLTNPSSSDTHLCIFNNPTDEEMQIRMRFFPLGVGLNVSEESSGEKYDIIISKLTNSDDMILNQRDWPQVPPNGTEIAFISLEGTGELRIEQVRKSSGTELILAKELEGHLSAHNKVQVRKFDFSVLNIADKNTFISTIISAAGLQNGFTNWEMSDDLISNSKNIPFYWLVDLIRHRYTNLVSNANDGISKSGLARLWNIYPTPECYIKNRQNTYSLEDYLLFVSEFDHILDPNYQGIDPDDIFSQPLPRPHRIIQRENGHLFVGKATLQSRQHLGEKRWSLLFDSRSTSQICSQLKLQQEDIVHIKSGHRLISTGDAEKLGIPQLNCYPDGLFYPQNPIELIEACFVNPQLFDNGKWTDFTSRWLDLESADIVVNVYASSMRQQWNGQPGWKNNVRGGLRVVRGKNSVTYRLEQLYRDPPSQTSQFSPPKLRAFRLHRITDSASDAVVIYHPDNPKIVAPPFRDYIDRSHSNLVSRAGFDLLRDVIRAYICAAKKWDNVRKPKEHLLPFIFREHLDNPDGLIKSIENEGINPDMLRVNILESLWVTP